MMFVLVHWFQSRDIELHSVPPVPLTCFARRPNTGNQSTITAGQNATQSSGLRIGEGQFRKHENADSTAFRLSATDKFVDGQKEALTNTSTVECEKAEVFRHVAHFGWETFARSELRWSHFERPWQNQKIQGKVLCELPIINELRIDVRSLYQTSKQRQRADRQATLRRTELGQDTQTFRVDLLAETFLAIGTENLARSQGCPHEF